MHGLPLCDTSQRTLRARQERHAFVALFRDLWGFRVVGATDPRVAIEAIVADHMGTDTMGNDSGDGSALAPERETFEAKKIQNLGKRGVVSNKAPRADPVSWGLRSLEELKEINNSIFH